MESIELEVKKSTIRKTGAARMCKTDAEKLDLSPGEEAVIKYGDESILLQIFEDDLLGQGTIKIREGDLEKLGAREGETVEIYPYTPIRSKVKDKLHL